jgi:hypothetical protein
MNSGTQVDLVWAGMDSAPGGAGVSLAPKNEGRVPVSDATGTAYLTDEEILGLEPLGSSRSKDSAVVLSEAKNPSDVFSDGAENRQRDSSGTNRPQNDTDEGRAHSETRDNAVNTSFGEMPAWMAAAAGDPRHSGEAQALWREHQEFRAAFASPEEARAVKELLPGGLRDALSLREASQSIERIDAALFSGDARAQAEVVAEIARANPAAFRALFAEAAKVLAGSGMAGRETGSREAGGKETRGFDGSDSSGLSDRPTLRANREGWGTRNSEAEGWRREVGGAGQTPDRNSSARGQSAPSDVQPPASDLQNSPFAGAQGKPVTTHATNHESQITNHVFDPAAYAAFERATNDAVARDVRGSIHDALARVMPEGVAEGAARRIGEDIFNEVHRALAADRSLSEQVAGALRERRFGAAEQQRVASLLAGRARQIVPGVARRVIGEWTSTVLNTARSKAARQAAAAARVDIASPGGSLDSMPLRQMSPREVSYASMSDEEILGM